MIKLSPSIMCADFSRLGEEIKELEKQGVDLLHFDINDGHFVPTITMGANISKVVRFLDKELRIRSEGGEKIDRPLAGEKKVLPREKD